MYYKKIALLCLCVSLGLQASIGSVRKPEINEVKNMDNQKKATQNKAAQPHRPQTPQPPFPYKEEEVAFSNSAVGIMLSGTLTIPNNRQQPPAVLLITGYGPHDRNMTGMGHAYFHVLADYLTRQGIAVLRYDKRGVGKSSGNFESATSKDLASDVESGIAYLRTRSDIDPTQIGLIGLSEGGLIASMVAAQSPDVAFVVLMAPAVITSFDYLVEQAGLQLRADGASEQFIAHDREIRNKIFAIVQNESPEQAEGLLRAAISSYLSNQTVAEKEEAAKLPFAFTLEKVDALVKVFNSACYRFFLSYDAVADLERINVPVLVVHGDRDWIASSKKVAAVVDKALTRAGNKDYTFIELPNLNHVFQTCQTGGLMEYAAIEETMSPVALRTIGEWIFVHTKI